MISRDVKSNKFDDEKRPKKPAAARLTQNPEYTILAFLESRKPDMILVYHKLQLEIGGSVG